MVVVNEVARTMGRRQRGQLENTTAADRLFTTWPQWLRQRRLSKWVICSNWYRRCSMFVFFITSECHASFRILFLCDTVIVIPFAGMDMWGMLHTVSRADFIRNTLKMLEKYMDIGYQQSLKHGPQARQFVVLFDMAGFNVKQYTWRPGLCQQSCEVTFNCF